MPLLTEHLRRRRYAMVEPFLRGKVLDIGCGNAATALSLESVQRYVGIDYRPTLVAHQREQFPQHEFYVCDVDHEPLPLREMRFDTVLMAAIIEHLANPGWVLDQVTGHLRPEGRLVITTPTPRGERVHWLGVRVGLFHPHAAEEHKGAYDRQCLEGLLAAHGFSVVQYRPFELGANQLVVCRPADATHSQSMQQGAKQ
ncbi:MAG: class I SAM-dependent methyltransferase [Anaerolineae bacterium]